MNRALLYGIAYWTISHEKCTTFIMNLNIRCTEGVRISNSIAKHADPLEIALPYEAQIANPPDGVYGIQMDCPILHLNFKGILLDASVLYV